MIPLRLQLHNFMCYQEPQTLDFHGIQLACLAGDNGHGKSALLDAITWALWGRARARSDDDLIAHGKGEMDVDLEFRLGDSHYRVLRKRQLGRTSKSTLEFQIKDGEGFRPLTSATLRDTQARINEVLRLDYDTFINSALLLQGRADEFTIKPPGERKRILAEILGLSIYDEYEQRAKERAKEKELSQRETAARIEEIERELTHRPEYVIELNAAQAELARLAAEARVADATLQSLRDRTQTLQAQHRQSLDLAKRVSETEARLEELDSQVERLEGRIAASETVLRQRDEIESAHAMLVEAREQERSYADKLTQLLELSEEKNTLEGRIAEARQSVELQIRLLSERLADLQRQTDGRDASALELAQVSSELDRLAMRQAQREQGSAALRDLTSEAATLDTLNAQLKSDMAATKDKLDLLQLPGAACPLCGQDLAETDRARIVQDLRKAGTQQADTFRRNSTRLKEIGTQMGAIETELAGIEPELRRMPALQGRLANLTQTVQDAARAAATLSEQQPTLRALQAKLQHQDFAQDEQARLGELNRRIAALGYNRAEHDRLRLSIVSLKDAEARRTQLHQSQQLLEQLLENRAQLLRTREEWKGALLADQERYTELAVALAGLEQLTRQLDDQVHLSDGLHASEGRARQTVGAAQQKLDTCNYLEGQQRERKREMDQLAEERVLFEHLQFAFGKKGLQALIIETAIPELEEEANRLLSKMTDGRMSMHFDTQRDTRSHSTIETLDIKVADENGSRSYEMYSGGEAFRINLAIRIALSKLLARRSGAQLQTLIVDEGFGTQDSDGRQKLVEAINSIRYDFALILVITHIEELKDAFPVRIDVYKTAQGSQISVA